MKLHLEPRHKWAVMIRRTGKLLTYAFDQEHGGSTVILYSRRNDARKRAQGYGGRVVKVWPMYGIEN